MLNPKPHSQRRPIHLSFLDFSAFFLTGLLRICVITSTKQAKQFLYGCCVGRFWRWKLWSLVLENWESKVYKVVSSHHLQRLFPTCCGTREDLARSLARKKRIRKVKLTFLLQPFLSKSNVFVWGNLNFFFWVLHFHKHVDWWNIPFSCFYFSFKWLLSE